MDIYNPWDDDELAPVEVEKSKKRRRRKNPAPTTIATPILLLIAGYLGWCAYAQSKYKVWNWQPWRLAGHPRLQLRRPSTNEAQRQQARQQSDLDKAIEQMMAAAPSVVEKDIWQKPGFKPTSEETVSFIEP
ncbi:hypothetical protein ES703_18072 [subsurface metagenome]